jgi:hypothetical protein
MSILEVLVVLEPLEPFEPLGRLVLDVERSRPAGLEVLDLERLEVRVVRRLTRRILLASARACNVCASSGSQALIR